MKTLTLGAGLLLGAATALFLPLQLPASVIGSVLNSQSQGKLSLVATDGNLWRGSAQPVLNGEALAEQLRWELRPSQLLRGRLEFDIGIDSGSAKLSIGPGGISLSNADISLAAAPLFKLDERAKAYALAGQLHLMSQNIHWAKGQPEGALLLEWRGAGSSLAPSLNPLGDYRVTAIPSGNGWQLQLSTLSGSLQINGNGSWQASQGFNLDLGLRASPGSEGSLTTLLTRIGPGAPNDERRLKFNFR
ncbi:type II secretion system protein N [Chitinimonas sp.]|uniref:type II secretion system protein N n=1 Tax=Chitinimonas sp. TaxID=1934313 RepID=UPI0035B0C16A